VPASPATAAATPAWLQEAWAAGSTVGRAVTAAPSSSSSTPAAPTTPAPAAGGAPERQAIAAAWALSNLGSKAYYDACQRFIEQAYGTGGQYRSAAQAGTQLVKTANPAEADVGDLVFFRPDPSNGMAGHAAIYLGNGEMVGATYGGVTRDRIDSPYWSKLLLGFGDPPNAWQGRASTDALAQGATQLMSTVKDAGGRAAAAGPASAAAAVPDWLKDAWAQGSRIGR
jgi:hypothetical protein